MIELLTARQVAELLGVSLWTLRKWTRDGLGPQPHRLGPRAIRYSREDVNAWLRSRRGVA
ncbi:MAG: helix-turn-helix transcriptional regulator [Pseudonocardiaceae bacterium]